MVSELATKHEQILTHIESLTIGTKISVRGIAKALVVSEGTAYRAIKEAENQGIVSTIERVGTIRIERKKKDNIERLTFAEIINIVDGQVLGGREGLYKTLNKFVIGAMKLDAMMRYTEAGSLLIVGNRTNAHELALKEGAAVLITGGFDTDENVKRLADEKQLPIISTSYDSFTVATMINRAIYDQLIKKEIVVVDDIYTPFKQSYFLYTTDLVKKWHELNEETMHSRYPVVDPQVGETIDDLATNQLQESVDMDDQTVYQTVVTPQMTNQLGTLSYGVFTSLVIEAGSRLLHQYKKGDLVVENLSIYFIKPVQLESMLEIKPRILEVGRKFAKVDVEVYNDRVLVGKALLMAQLIDR